MSREVLGVRAPDGRTRLSVREGGREVEVERSVGLLDASPEGWTWGQGGRAARLTALTVLRLLGMEEELAPFWAEDFLRDWVQPAPPSRLAVTQHELSAWLAKETLKDLATLRERGKVDWQEGRGG